MRASFVAAAVAALLALACGDGEPGGSRLPGGADALDTGDLAAVRERGTLRLLSLRGGEDFLPRTGSARDRERALAEGLAHDLGVSAEWVEVGSLGDLVPALLEGRGDVVVTNFTRTAERRRKVRFSAPVATVRARVIARAADAIGGPADLAGRTLAVRPSSSHWPNAVALVRGQPELLLVEAPEHWEALELLDAVAEGTWDATIVDSNVFQGADDLHEELAAAFPVGVPTVLGWALRPESPQLLRAVDAYLAGADSKSARRLTHTDDLPALRERGVLRVLTRNSAATYFLWRGQLMGFEYELAREFAKRHGMRLEVVVPPSREDLLQWLREGKGDIVAAGLTANEERAHLERVLFSRNYLGSHEMVVSRASDPVAAFGDLRGREFWVRFSSSYWLTLEKLEEEYGFRLRRAPEEMETEAIIAAVAEGKYDLTVADSHVLDIELTWRDDIRGAFALGDPVQHGWAVRRKNPELRTAVDAFFTQEFRGLFYNMMVARYFRNARKVARHVGPAPDRNRLSPYDPKVRDLALEFGFDWRLIAAQMYQESRFDPTARSFAGARGILQVLPRTARQMGIEGDLADVDVGLRAGVSYLAWLRERFPKDLDPRERIWLALAAYNVGIGHVRDARAIARRREWDPGRWFEHVEQAMLLKERPDVHRSTRFGYARGREPVAYVRDIRARYEAYLQAEPVLSEAH